MNEITQRERIARALFLAEWRDVNQEDHPEFIAADFAFEVDAVLAAIAPAPSAGDGETAREIVPIRDDDCPNCEPRWKQRDAISSALARARVGGEAAGLKRALAIVNAEEELVGEPSLGERMAIHADPVAACRAAVRATKTNIARAIESLAPADGGQGGGR